jgi:simple sugar transport system permease protein
VTRRFPSGLVVQPVALILLAGLFFAANGIAPLPLFGRMLHDSFGGPFSISQTLLNAVVIGLCAISVALPARLGLISVGAEGEMVVGAIAGTGAMLALVSAPWYVLLPAIIAAAMAGGFIWGGLIGLLRAYFNANETISSLMLNFIAVDILEFLINGPWQDPTSGNWPTSISFPKTALPPTYALGPVTFHSDLLVAVVAAAALFFVFAYTRAGFIVRILRNNARLAPFVHAAEKRWIVILLAVAGVFPALAGIYQSTLVQGNLQGGFFVGYGMAGFVAAWLARNDFMLLLISSLLLGGLFSAADALQLDANLPSSTSLVLEAIVIFVVLLARRFERRGAAARP